MTTRKQDIIFNWIKNLWGIGVLAFMWTHLGHPALPLVLQSLTIFEVLGAALLIILPLLKSAMEIQKAHAYKKIVATLFRGMILYSLGVWFITQAGDTMERYITTHPERAVTLGMAIVVLFALNWINDLFAEDKPEKNAYPGKNTLEYAQHKQPLTLYDLKRTAAHEAGHALTLAALGRQGIPSKMTVNVFSSVTETGKIGTLYLSFDDRNVLKSKVFMEWFLLMLLAGQVGESHLTEASIGNQSDYELWFHYAKSFLENQYHGLYVLHPWTNAEAQSNQKIMQTLLDQQKAMIQEFITLNESAHRTLADALFKKRKLSKSELMPFLESVQFPEGFPLPFQKN